MRIAESPLPINGFARETQFERMHIQRLGKDATMRAAQDHAERFVETYRADWGGEAERLVLPAIELRNWQVLPMLLDLDDVELERLTAALRGHGAVELSGFVVSPRHPRPSVAWRVPSTALALRNFWSHHKGMETLLLPPAEDVLLFCESEQFLVLAGPPALLRKMAGEGLAEMLREVVAHAAEMDRINGHAGASELLRHYEAVVVKQ